MSVFWKARGPVTGGPGSVITAHIPEMTPGPTTLNGVTGFIPDLWDGIQPGVRSQLDWNYTVMVFNTSTEDWGIGGAFDWNNQNTAAIELLTNHAAIETSTVYYQ